MRDNFENPKHILCFNAHKKLIGIFASYRELERLAGFKHSCIQRACHGQVVSAYGHYWRELDNETIIESDDLLNLNLAQYDLGVLGRDRLVYVTSAMGKGKKTIMVSKLAKKLNA